MTIKFVTKPKLAQPVTKGKAKTAESDVRTKLVDTLVSDADAYAAAKKLVDGYDKLKGKLKALIPDNLSPDQEITFVGTNGDVVFSAQGNVREVSDQDALIEALGPEVFAQIAKVPLGMIDQYVTPMEQEAFITTTRTGPRKFSIRDKE